jgi:hypothetical protein
MLLAVRLTHSPPPPAGIGVEGEGDRCDRIEITGNQYNPLARLYGKLDCGERMGSTVVLDLITDQYLLIRTDNESCSK